MKLKQIPAQTGVAWVREGLSIFFKQPLRLTSFFVLYMLVSGIFSIIPIIGAAFSLILIPFLSVILMVAAAQIRQGKQVAMPLVFVTFKELGKQENLSLLKLGVAYSVYLALLIALTVSLDGGTFLRVYTGQEEPTQAVMTTGSFMASFWLVTLLSLIGNTLLLFAPGLVYWFKLPASQAIFYSMMACKRNFAAIAIYILTWGGIAVALMLGVVMMITFLMMLGVPMTLAIGLYLVGILMFMSASMASAAFAVRDNFEAPDV